MSSAAAIRRKNNKSTIGDLIAPNRPKTFTKNHHAENIQKIKELQNFAVAKRNEVPEPTIKETFTMKQFQNIPSKLAQQGLGHSPNKSRPTTMDNDYDNNDEYLSFEENTDPSARYLSSPPRVSTSSSSSSRPSPTPSTSPKHTEFLRRKPRTDPTAVIPKPFVRESIIRKPSVPKKNEIVEMPTREIPNFVTANTRAAVTATTKRPASVDPMAPAPKHSEYGQVPSYLKERKDTWNAQAEAIAAKAKETEGCPAGHKLMPDAERLETLTLLKASMDEAHQALAQIKFTSDAPSTVKRRNELEIKIKKMEDAIQVFSRPRVFVKI